ncbi:hypothetical protein GGR58DRAFT_505583 [Xylaria digitata]|nr:hypothetical protein GGR58DRAFT_505583 [Xylaria digitata]
MTDLEKSLVKRNAKLFNNPKYANVKFHIGEYELPAHSVVLASRNLYFKKALGENFCEEQMKQFHFEEKGISMHAHWKVFEYMYTGNYLENAAGTAISCSS